MKILGLKIYDNKFSIFNPLPNSIYVVLFENSELKSFVIEA